MSFFDYQGTELQNDKQIENRWKGKKIVCFGDSRTYYDGKTYWDYAKDEWAGKPYTGYQQQLRDLLGMTVVSIATPGYTIKQICSSIKSHNFTGYDACFLDGGINDWNNDGETTNVGELAPIGSSFDLNTRYGNWQSAIEYVLNNYPTVKIFMNVSYIGWYGSGSSEKEFPYSNAEINKKVAELYNIPCLDLYKTAGLNKCNRDYYYADATGSVHLNDYGNKLIGGIIAGFIVTH